MVILMRVTWKAGPMLKGSASNDGTPKRPSPDLIHGKASSSIHQFASLKWEHPLIKQTVTALIPAEMGSHFFDSRFIVFSFQAKMQKHRSVSADRKSSSRRSIVFSRGNCHARDAQPKPTERRTRGDIPRPCILVAHLPALGS